MKELPEPVTFAAGEPEPHCAVATEASARRAVRLGSCNIVVVVAGVRNEERGEKEK